MSEPPANQEMDLRSELQNVQQRMKKTEAIGNSLQQAAKELEDHIKNQNGSTSDEQGQLLKQKLSSLQDEYDQIMKDGQLLSKPSVSVSYIPSRTQLSVNQTGYVVSSFFQKKKQKALFCFAEGHFIPETRRSRPWGLGGLPQEKNLFMGLEACPNKRRHLRVF
jgi:hypothetical protein